MTIKPFKHQEKSIAFFNKTPISLDASDPGTGKTGSHICWYARRPVRTRKRMLVLAPKSILDCSWADDIKKFAPTLNTTVAYARNRKEALASNSDVLVTNHDAVKELMKQHKRWFDTFDTIVVDESTAFKHRTSARSRALAKIVKHFKYRRILTGTPNSNGICDLWHQIYLIDDGKRLGKSFFSFRNATCTPVQTGPRAEHITWVDSEGIEEKVFMLIEDITVRHIFEECTDIPKNHQYPLSYTLPAKHRKLYGEMEDTSLLLVKERSISAINGAVLYQKLMQVASGASYDDYGEYTLLDTERYEMTMDLVEQRKHSVVAFLWAHQKAELIKLAEKRGIRYAVIDGTVSSARRTQIVTDYQKGAYQVLFANPAAAAHGLTLTRGCATIWPSPTYNLEHFKQFNRRIYRIGQKNKTETIVLVAKGTVDERVYDAYLGKDARMSALLKEMAQCFDEPSNDTDSGASNATSSARSATRKNSKKTSSTCA